MHSKITNIIRIRKVYLHIDSPTKRTEIRTHTTIAIEKLMQFTPRTIHSSVNGAMLSTGQFEGQSMQLHDGTL